MNTFKCHFCKICNGKGCINDLPGMGGVSNNQNFIKNYEGWNTIPFGNKGQSGIIRLAPMTGAIQNVGYPDEKQFYFDMINECVKASIPVTIGDGAPDEKLLYGIEAVKNHNGLKAGVFIKPYPQEKIFQRIEWCKEIASSVGVDIDSYNIATMRNQAHLEKKSAQQLTELKKYVNSLGIPFVIKGIFTEEDLNLVKEVQPDVAYVSNHGGRIETRLGSTADFLTENSELLKNYSSQLWVDGGIRNKEQAQKAFSYGADSVLLGRPFIQALCKNESFEKYKI